MKALHIADTHIRLGERWTECTRVLSHIAQRVEELEPDIVLHAGDVFDRKSEPAEMRFAERWAQRIANVCPLVIARGNHDAEYEVEGFERLSSTFPIYAPERPRIIRVSNLSIAVLPWPSLANVVADADCIGLGTAGMNSRDSLRAIYDYLGTIQMESDLPTLALMHCMRSSAKTSADQPLRGCDFEVNNEDLELLNCEAYLLGHIHKAQTLSPPKHRDWLMRYCGSPFHTDFGDWCDKSLTIWEYDSEHITGYSTEPLPAHQMIEVRGIYSDSELVLDQDFDIENVEFKLTYSFDPQYAKAAHAEAREWRNRVMEHGAFSVALNPQANITTRARAPEVSTAVTPEDKLRAHICSIGEDPDDAAHQRELEKFSKLRAS